MIEIIIIVGIDPDLHLFFTLRTIGFFIRIFSFLSHGSSFLLSHPGLDLFTVETGTIYS